MQTDQRTKLDVDTKMNAKEPESSKDAISKLEKVNNGASRNNNKLLAH